MFDKILKLYYNYAVLNWFLKRRRRIKMNSHNRGFWIVCIAFLTALGIAGTATAKLIEFVQNPIKHVVLDDDGYCVEISTYDSSVGELLNRYGIVLEPG